MHFDPSIRPFLSGAEFSNALMVDLKGGSLAPMNRLDYIVDLCRGKRVVHIGFADHLPLIDEKRRKQIWLHDLLIKAASQCVGIDVNAQAVTYCKESLGVPFIFQHNLLTDAPLPVITNATWDVAILGEIVEHLSDPVLLLTRLREKYGGCIERLVITVPNAWDVANFLLALRSQEFINSDHRFWFTPYTLAKICNDAGFSPVEFTYVDHCADGGVVRRWMRRRYPMLRQTLVGIFHSR